jgi:hypothetical protein
VPSSEYTLEIGTDERLGALGMTGYGKSFLVLRWVAQLERCIVVDTKHEIRIPGYTIIKKEDAVFSRFGSPNKVIYRPRRSRLPDSFFGRVWGRFGSPRKPKAVVYIDEAANVTTEHRIGDELKNCVQAGRSVGLGVWWSAQNSTRVNNTLLSLTDKLAIFRMNVESDRKKLGGVVGQKTAEAAAILGRYQFVTAGWPEVEAVEAEGEVNVTVLELDETQAIIKATRTGEQEQRGVAE